MSGNEFGLAICIGLLAIMCWIIADHCVALEKRIEQLEKGKPNENN